jgi:hypothetical protein
MNIHRQTSSQWLWLIALGVIAWAASNNVARAQDRTLSEREVADLVERTLPAWDKSVLEVKDGEDWSAKLDFDVVLKALGEKGLRTQPAADARRVADGTRVLRVTKEQGKVRFVERSRAWNPAQAAQKPVDPQAAAKLTSSLLANLGVPRAELLGASVDVQLGLDEDLRRRTDSKLHSMYSLVSIGRSVNKLEVYGSRARAAVTNVGALQRLRLTWPTFRLAKELTLRERKAVVKQAVETIVRQQASVVAGSKLVSARLAYVPETSTLPYIPRKAADEKPGNSQENVRDADDDVSKLGPETFKLARAETVQYVPAVVVTVAASPTPYELLIPVAE